MLRSRYTFKPFLSYERKGLRAFLSYQLELGVRRSGTRSLVVSCGFDFRSRTASLVEGCENTRYGLSGTHALVLQFYPEQKIPVQT